MHNLKELAIYAKTGLREREREQAASFECYSLVLVMSMDKRDTAQLVVFMCGVDKKLHHMHTHARKHRASHVNMYMYTSIV